MKRLITKLLDNIKVSISKISKMNIGNINSKIDFNNIQTNNVQYIFFFPCHSLQFKHDYHIIDFKGLDVNFTRKFVGSWIKNLSFFFLPNNRIFYRNKGQKYRKKRRTDLGQALGRLCGELRGRTIFSIFNEIWYSHS